jgi:hypothetical protein
MKSLEAKFWAKAGWLGKTSEQCWLWKKGLDKDGFGTVKHSYSTLAHRVAWIYTNELGVIHRATINDIIRGATWKHIER